MTPARTAVTLAAIIAVIATTLPLEPGWRALATLVVGAVGCAWIASALRRDELRSRAGWLMGAAAVLNVGCSLVWLWPALTGAGDPSIQSNPVATGNLLLAAALIVAITRREGVRIVLLEVLCLVVGAGLVVGLLIIAPVLRDAGVPPGTRAVHSARLIVDIVLIAAVTRVLLAPRGRPLSLWLLAAAGAGVVASDILSDHLTLLGSHLPGSAADLGWTVQPLLIGLAALHPSMRRLGIAEDRTNADLRLSGAFLVGVTCLTAPLLLGAHALVPAMPDVDDDLGSSVTLLIAGIVLAVTASARFLLLVRRTRQLAEAHASALNERGQMLDRSEARYRGLIEEVPAVVVLYALRDDRLEPVYVSPKAESICGITADEWLAHPLEAQRRIHPDDLLVLQMKLTDQAMGMKGNEVEFRFQRPDGEEIWLRDVSGVVTEEPEGRYLHSMLVDVTKFKHASRERAAMENELRLSQKLEAVGELSAGIAHEINTPIQFVGDTFRFLQDAFSDLLVLMAVQNELREAAEAGPVDPALVQRVRDAEEAADLDYLRERVPAALARGVDGVSRVATIGRAMRDFAHPPTVEKAPVDVGATVNDTLIVAANAYKYVADVELDIEDLPTVMGNGGELSQVFLNLLVNAAHAIEGVVGDSGGRGTIRITAHREGDDVIVSIADTGCGIPDEIADRVFDPFFTTKDVGRGTGQGLALSRTMIVERHGGTLTFETDPGRGTTFHVRLPISVPDLVATP